MIAYFNMILSNEEITTTRQKYTWLDAFAFVGGNFNLIFIILYISFYFYNYGIQNYEMYFLIEKERL